MKNHPLYLSGTVLAVLFVAGCASMPEISKLAPNAPVDPNHLYYWLPKTELMVDLPIKRTTKSIPTLLTKARQTAERPEPEAYVKYLGEQLKDFDPTTVPLAKTSAYEMVGKDVALTSGGVEDPDARFDAGLQVNFFEKLKLSMEFSPRMVMQKAEVEVTNQILPTVVATLKAAGGIANLHMTAAFTARQATPPPEPAKDERKQWQIKVDTALTELNRVKSERKDILGGSVSFADAAQMQLALDALEREETELTTALFGSSEEKTWVATCRFAPTKDQLTVVVGKLHEAGGFEPVGDAVANRAVSPFAYNAKAMTLWDWRNPKSLNPDYVPERDDDGVRTWLSAPEEVSVIEVGCAPLEPRANPVLGKESLQPKGGSYVYRVPQKALAFVQVKEDGTSVAPAVIKQAEVMVAQLGELRQLPQSLGAATGSYAITLDGDTGALLSLTANADPGDLAGTVESVGGIIQSRQEARKTAREAAATAAAENTPEKKRAAERADLDNIKAIRDLKAQLGLTDSADSKN